LPRGAGSDPTSTLPAVLTVLLVASTPLAPALGPASGTDDPAAEAADTAQARACEVGALPGVERCEDWTATWNPGVEGEDSVEAVATTPDGETVFATGRTTLPDTDWRMTTAAYDADTGERLWTDVATGESTAYGLGRALAYDPVEDVVFAGGFTPGDDQDIDTTVRALDADTGQLLWRFHEDGGARGLDAVRDLKLGPDREQLVVAAVVDTHPDRETVDVLGLDPGTGEVRWTYRYLDDTPEFDARPTAIEVADDGSTAYVAGTTEVPSRGGDAMLVLAVDLATGERAWRHVYQGPVGFLDQAEALTVGSQHVYATGASLGDGTSFDAVTFAVNATTGSRAWLDRYDGPASGGDVTRDIVHLPDQDRVVVAGGAPDGDGLAALGLAYDPSTGERVWEQRYHSTVPRDADIGAALAAAPDGEAVYLVGASDGTGRTVHDYHHPRDRDRDVLTVRLDTRTGELDGAARWDGSQSRFDGARAVAASEDRVLVGGVANGLEEGADWTLLTYPPKFLRSTAAE